MRSVLFSVVTFVFMASSGQSATLVKAVGSMCSGKAIQTTYAASAADYARVAASVKRIHQQNTALEERCNKQVRAETIANGVRVHFPSSCYGVGVQALLNIQPSERAYLEYNICHSEDFHFRGGKMPGLIGGSKGGGAGGGGSCERFSARPMFNDPRDGTSAFAGGGANTYAYWCDQPNRYGGCGRECRWRNGEAVLFSGKCSHIGSQVIMNTPGNHDGVIRYWVDGDLVMQKTNFRFRDDTSIQINAVLFSVFFGGSSPRWAPVTNGYAEYTNFRVWTDPPSCSKAFSTIPD